MLTTGNVFGTDAAQAVMYKLAGYRTVAERVCEYFGLQKEDLTKAEKLKSAGVALTPRLIELWVKKEDLQGLFKDILPNDYFDGNQKRSTSESSDASDVGAERNSSLDSSKKRARRGKAK